MSSVERVFGGNDVDSNVGVNNTDDNDDNDDNHDNDNNVNINDNVDSVNNDDNEGDDGIDDEGARKRRPMKGRPNVKKAGTGDVKNNLLRNLNQMCQVRPQ